VKKLFAAAFVIYVFSGCAVTVAASSAAEEHARIEQVVATFRTSLINKDKSSFLKLFYSESIPWIGVTTDKSLARENASKPDPKMPDVKKLYTSGNPKFFIENIAKNPARIEEKFDNVRIESDGDVAQVWFDYSFNKDGYMSNWGKESWHMVRTEDGWKISSVIWSMEFNPEPPPGQAKGAP
jgi:hypothetical protein